MALDATALLDCHQLGVQELCKLAGILSSALELIMVTMATAKLAEPKQAAPEIAARLGQTANSGDVLMSRLRAAIEKDRVPPVGLADVPAEHVARSSAKRHTKKVKKWKESTTCNSCPTSWIYSDRIAKSPHCQSCGEPWHAPHSSPNVGEELLLDGAGNSNLDHTSWEPYKKTFRAQPHLHENWAAAQRVQADITVKNDNINGMVKCFSGIWRRQCAYAMDSLGHDEQSNENGHSVADVDGAKPGPTCGSNLTDVEQTQTLKQLESETAIPEPKRANYKAGADDEDSELRDVGATGLHAQFNRKGAAEHVALDNVPSEGLKVADKTSTYSQQVCAQDDASTTQDLFAEFNDIISEHELIHCGKTPWLIDRDEKGECSLCYGRLERFEISSTCLACDATHCQECISTSIDGLRVSS